MTVMIFYDCSSVLGIPLGISKDQFVPTGKQFARVRGRASIEAEAEVRTRASWRVTRSDSDNKLTEVDRARDLAARSSSMEHVMFYIWHMAALKESCNSGIKSSVQV
ncbi:hypothetical protein E5676_scaffold313G00350 [Cucumis melo var. makuwa]|uniref:Uncharacterized protein n=1 Tax=Cucumis melo var. makuwa TaxID=1194695 RepID=A0A5D3DT84_CUCMM|nr:hypothetical protein E5676_scaffold313G00350 [Cucumis melo var. makuwa]